MHTSSLNSEHLSLKLQLSLKQFGPLSYQLIQTVLFYFYFIFYKPSLDGRAEVVAHAYLVNQIIRSYKFISGLLLL